MEKEHGPHRDLKQLEGATDYSKYGPLGVCKEIREQYADQVCLKTWPSLTPSIPSANLGNVQLSTQSGNRKNPNDINIISVAQNTT